MAPLYLLFEAQRRRAEAAVDYTGVRAHYAVATKNVHFVKGTLLEYDGVYLTEGPWPGEAYHDAAKREASRSGSQPLNYASSLAPVVSRGPHAQQVGGETLPHELPADPEDASPWEVPHLPPPDPGRGAAPAAENRPPAP
jgi:hypothetical protein